MSRECEVCGDIVDPLKVLPPIICDKCSMKRMKEIEKKQEGKK